MKNNKVVQGTVLVMQDFVEKRKLADKLPGINFRLDAGAYLRQLGFKTSLRSDEHKNRK